MTEDANTQSSHPSGVRIHFPSASCPINQTRAIEMFSRFLLMFFVRFSCPACVPRLDFSFLGLRGRIFMQRKHKTYLRRSCFPNREKLRYRVEVSARPSLGSLRVRMRHWFFATADHSVPILFGVGHGCEIWSRVCGARKTKTKRQDHPYYSIQQT